MTRKSKEEKGRESYRHEIDIQNVVLEGLVWNNALKSKPQKYVPRADAGSGRVLSAL